MHDIKTMNLQGAIVLDPPVQHCSTSAHTAAERLIRDGLIDAETYERMFAAEAASWQQVMGMDEAALDAELGVEEQTRIDMSAGTAGLSRGRRGVAEAPQLRVVGEPPKEPAPYREHFRIRLAGVSDGLMSSRAEIDEELRGIKRLMMATGECLRPDVFLNLHSYLGLGQLLVVERLTNGGAELEGCVAYQQQDLVGAAGESGGLVKQRINLLRLLAVRDGQHGALLSTRLYLEAQLRGTVRGMQGLDGLGCIGTLGTIIDADDGAPTWASRLGDRIRVLRSTAKAAANDRTLTAFRDQLDALQENGARKMPYRFIIANRMQLLEAAKYHLIGVVPYHMRQDEPDLRIDYDTDDPCSPQVFRAADKLVARDADTLRQFGLVGRRDASLWGPPPTLEMSQPIGARRTRQGGFSRVGVAA